MRFRAHETSHQGDTMLPQLPPTQDWVLVGELLTTTRKGSGRIRPHGRPQRLQRRQGCKGAGSATSGIWVGQ